MAKRDPYITFYPADWLADEALNSCSHELKGVWIDLLCYMHRSPRPGYLMKPDGTPHNSSSLGVLLKKKSSRTQVVLDLLLSSSVVRYDLNLSCYYSKRMVEDNAKRLQDKENGAKGGRPKQAEKPNPPPNPSSSSSLTSSLSLAPTNNPPISPKGDQSKFCSKPDDVSQEVWDDWIVHRKAKKTTFLETALKSTRDEAAKAGYTLEQAIAACLSSGWQGFKAAYVANKGNFKGTGGVSMEMVPAEQRTTGFQSWDD